MSRSFFVTDNPRNPNHETIIPFIILLTGTALAQTPSPFKKPLTLPGSSGAFDDVRAAGISRTGAGRRQA